MKKFIALLMVLGLVGFAVAQDLDAPTSGVAVQPVDNGGGEGGELFDMLMAKMAAQKAEIEANRVTRWAFDTRYGWIWLSGRDHYGWGGMSGNEAGYDEFAYAKENLTPAEYAEFSAQAEETWWALEAQGLN